MGIVLAHMGFLGATLRTFGEFELPLVSGAAALALAATGPLADQWLDLAQAYRGPAGPGRSPGQFAALRD